MTTYYAIRHRRHSFLFFSNGHSTRLPLLFAEAHLARRHLKDFGASVVPEDWEIVAWSMTLEIIAASTTAPPLDTPGVEAEATSKEN